MHVQIIFTLADIKKLVFSKYLGYYLEIISLGMTHDHIFM